MPALDAPALPLDALIARCLDALQVERGISATTMRDYRNDIRRFVAWLQATGRPATLDACSRPTLLAWLQARAAQVGPATVAREFGAARAFSAWLVREGILTADPARLIRGPKAPRPLPRALPAGDLLAAFDAIPTRTPEGRRLKAMLEVLFASGRASASSAP